MLEEAIARTGSPGKSNDFLIGKQSESLRWDKRHNDCILAPASLGGRQRLGNQPMGASQKLAPIRWVSNA